MASELAPIDIRHVPELAHLVDEVQTTRKPRRITRDNEDVAVLMPARPRLPRLRGKRVTQADIDAAMSVFGAWKDQVDPETLKRELRELQVDDKPPIEL
jgi:prevent-host-death family protein